MLDSVTYHLNKFFSSLSQSFPDCIVHGCSFKCIDVYAPHATNDEDKVLIDESEKEGKKFSTHFRDVYGDSCSQFLDSSLLDAVMFVSLFSYRLPFHLWKRNHWYCIWHHHIMRIIIHLHRLSFLFFLTSRLLADRVVVEYLKENSVCWGCDVTSKYGYSLVLVHDVPNF